MSWKTSQNQKKATPPMFSGVAMTLQEASSKAPFGAV